MVGVDGERAVDMHIEALRGPVRNPWGVGESSGLVDSEGMDVGAGMASQLSKGSGRDGPASTDDAHAICEGFDGSSQSTV